MDRIMRNISCAFVYLDDILIASQDSQSHKRDLRDVFQLLSTHGIVLNRKKCVFGKERVQYLGHLVDSRGISLLPERVESI